MGIFSWVSSTSVPQLPWDPRAAASLALNSFSLCRRYLLFSFSLGCFFGLLQPPVLSLAGLGHLLGGPFLCLEQLLDALRLTGHGYGDGASGSDSKAADDGLLSRISREIYFLRWHDGAGCQLGAQFGFSAKGLSSPCGPLRGITWASPWDYLGILESQLSRTDFPRKRKEK